MRLLLARRDFHPHGLHVEKITANLDTLSIQVVTGATSSVFLTTDTQKKRPV